MSKNDILLTLHDIAELEIYTGCASSALRYMRSVSDSDLLNYIVDLFDNAIFHKIDELRNKIEEIGQQDEQNPRQ